MGLQIRAVRKVYPNGKEALKVIDTELTSGVYGLLGPNGAGKSTLINILTCNLEATEGEVLYNGNNINKLGRKYRKLIGYMPQQQELYDSFTGIRFLWYMAALKGMPDKLTKERIPKLLNVVNLEAEGKMKIGVYSGGMKQRLLLAQALLDDPPILILDEPTAGLDPKERIRIRNFVSEISKDKTVLLATHVVTDIECIAKKIILLKDGRLEAQASPMQLAGSIEGRVWECIADEKKLSALQREYCISNITMTSSGYKVRIVNDYGMPGWDNVSPSLEDAYLYHFQYKL